MAENYHALTTGEVLALFSTSKQGLSEEKAKARLQEFGLNELQKEKRSNAFFLFVGQFRNALSILLIFAGVLSLFTSDKLEAIAIFSILFINSTLGFIQEYRAEKAMEALEKISAPSARVLRDGKQRKIPARDLVPGDIIMLEAGDIVLTQSNPQHIVRLIILSRKVYRKMLQNLFWAVGYNVVAIPAAAGLFIPLGFRLTPAVGALLMSLSSVIVVINAMTLRKAKLNI